jgi:GDP-L-fucose synthase
MYSKILVTGGTGLLGYALKQLCPQAIFVGSRDYDLTDACEARRLFETIRPDAVIHLAAKVGGVSQNAKCNADFFTINAQINANVLSAVAKYGVSRIISLLSTCAFPATDQTLTDEDLHKSLPFDGHLGYGFSKRMLDIHSRLLYQQYKIQASTFAPVTLYGPHDNWNPEEGHVLGALIYKCFQAKQNGSALEVWGTGKAIRQFIFSLDVARILLRSLEQYSGPETVLITPDEGISIQNLAQAIAKAMDFKGPIIFDTKKPEGQSVRRLVSKKFSEYFPDFHFTSLEDGLQQTVAWYEENEAQLSMRERQP